MGGRPDLPTPSGSAPSVVYGPFHGHAWSPRQRAQGLATRWCCACVAGAVSDSLLLALVGVLSSALYIGRLGFYSDDWWFLSTFHFAPDQSVLGLFSAADTPDVAMRPAQILSLAALYRVFRDSPLGYQLANQAVLIVGMVALSLTLRRIGVPRYLAVAVPVVWGLLPNYSADRFWFLAFQITLSATLYIVSLYSDLRGADALGIRHWAWKAASILTAVVAGLAYEVVMPLLALSAALVWWYERRRPLASINCATRLAYPLIDVGLLIALGLFKQQTTIRQGNHEGLSFYVEILRNMVRLDQRPDEYGLNLRQAASVHFGYYGLRLPLVAWRYAIEYADLPILVLSLCTGLLVFFWLNRLAQQEGSGIGDRIASAKLMVAGVVVFALGYAVFLTNTNVQFTPTGIGNRTAIAATAGAAMTLVGLAGWLSSFISCRRWRAWTASGGIAAIAACGLLIVNSLSLFWIDAWGQERQILSSVERAFPGLQPGSTVVLDGSCPYDGPAVIFESSWDLLGALRMHYEDPTLKADVLSPRAALGPDALTTSLYGVTYRYPYGDRTFIFNAATVTVYPMPGRDAAQRYFDTVRPTNRFDCPSGHEGLGVPLF